MIAKEPNAAVAHLMLMPVRRRMCQKQAIAKTVNATMLMLLRVSAAVFMTSPREADVRTHRPCVHYRRGSAEAL
jgi:hypothetical protein